MSDADRHADEQALSPVIVVTAAAAGGAGTSPGSGDAKDILPVSNARQSAAGSGSERRSSDADPASVANSHVARPAAMLELPARDDVEIDARMPPGDGANASRLTVATEMPPVPHPDPAKSPPSAWAVPAAPIPPAAPSPPVIIKRTIIRKGTRHFTWDGVPWRALLGETMCTFVFVFGIIMAGESERRYVLYGPGEMTAMDTDRVSSGIVATFALISVLYTFEGLSGAFSSPLVVIGTWVGGRIGMLQAMLMILADVLGAIIAVLVMGYLTPDEFAVLRLVPVVDMSKLQQQLAGDFVFGFVTVLMVYAVDHRMRTLAARRKVSRRKKQARAALSSPGAIELAAARSELSAEIAEDIGRRPAPYIGPMMVGIAAGVCSLYGINVVDQMTATASYLATRQFGGVLWTFWVGNSTGAVCAALLFVFGVEGGFPEFEVIEEGPGAEEIIEREHSGDVVVDVHVAVGTEGTIIGGAPVSLHEIL